MAIKNKVQSNDISKEIIKYAPNIKSEVIEKFVLAALGSIPWVGGFVSAAASIKTEEGYRKYNELQLKWLKEHEEKIKDLEEMLKFVIDRFNTLGDTITERISEPDYLALVRRVSRVWDEAETKEKKQYVANILVNSAGTNLCSDDVIRMFTDWLDIYHELHFSVIGEIYKNGEITRYQIWKNIAGDPPADNSAEAGLFSMLIRDLTLGGVIRQKRMTNSSGQFVRQTGRNRVRTSVMETPFENTKLYELTALGQQFVHYTMSDIVKRLDTDGQDS